MYGAAFLWCAFFVYTRLHDDVFGGHVRFGWAEHSVPRYLTPVYLVAVLAPLVFLGRCRRLFLVPGVLVALAVSGWSLWEIGVHQPSSFEYLHEYVPQNQAILERLKREVPENAMVYTVTADKITWSAWQLGTIDDLGQSATSISRAVAAGFKVYMLDNKYESPSHRRLGTLLARKQLTLVPVSARHGVYRVQQGVTLWPPNARY